MCSREFQWCSRRFKQCSIGFQGVSGFRRYRCFRGLPGDFSGVSGVFYGFSRSFGVSGIFQEYFLGNFQKRSRGVSEDSERYHETSRDVLGVFVCVRGVPENFYGFQDIPSIKWKSFHHLSEITWKNLGMPLKHSWNLPWKPSGVVSKIFYSISY